MDIKEFFGTDWRSMMSDEELAEAERLDKLCPMDRAKEGSEKWDKEGEFKSELLWNLWAKAFKDRYLVEIKEGEPDLFGNNKKQPTLNEIFNLDPNFIEKNSINFSKNQKRDANDNYYINTQNFTGFIFPFDVDFSKAIFKKNNSFEGATFFNFANFSDSTFNHFVDFFRVIFTERVDFYNVDFQGRASFLNTEFWGVVNFKYSRFRKETFFINCYFFGFNDFSLIKSDDYLDFRNSLFYNTTDFSNSKLIGHLNLQFVGFGTTFYIKDKNFVSSILKNITKFKSQSTFNSITTIEKDTIPNFSGIKTSSPPNLSETKISYDLDFGNANASSKFRVLKEIAAKNMNHDKELEFFRHELLNKKYSGDSTPWTAILVWFYEFFSHCGTKAFRPFGFLIFFTFLAFPIIYYGLQMGFQPELFNEAVFLSHMKYSFHQAVPILSLGGEEAKAVVNKLYIDYDLIPHSVGIISGFQKIISLALEFLLLLTIRNYYRM